MNLWKANPLRSRADVWQRAVFRTFWGLVGGAIAALLIFRVGIEGILIVWAFYFFGVVLGGAWFDMRRLPGEPDYDE